MPKRTEAATAQDKIFVEQILNAARDLQRYAYNEAHGMLGLLRVDTLTRIEFILSQCEILNNRLGGINADSKDH